MNAPDPTGRRKHAPAPPVLLAESRLPWRIAWATRLKSLGLSVHLFAGSPAQLCARVRAESARLILPPGSLLEADLVRRLRAAGARREDALLPEEVRRALPAQRDTADGFASLALADEHLRAALCGGRPAKSVTLSRRERQEVTMTMDGRSLKQMQSRLGRLTTRSLNSYRRRAMAKCGVRMVAEPIRRYGVCGLPGTVGESHAAGIQQELVRLTEGSL